MFRRVIAIWNILIMKLVFLLKLYALLALQQFVKAENVAPESKKLPDTNVSANNENEKTKTAVSLTLTSLPPIITKPSDEDHFYVPYSDSPPYHNEIPYYRLLTVDVPSLKEYQPKLRRTIAKEKLSESEILSKAENFPLKNNKEVSENDKIKSNSISSSEQENLESNTVHSIVSTLGSKISPAGEMSPQVNETLTGSTVLPLSKHIPDPVSSPSDEQTKKDYSDTKEEKEGKHLNATSSSSHHNHNVTKQNSNQMNYNVSKNKPSSKLLGCNIISYIINTNRSNNWKAIPEARVPPYSKFGYSLIKSRELDLDLEEESEIECPADDCQLPQSYDSRSSYPICTTLQQPLDQGCNCKASWAVSAASAFSDRLCISTGGQISPELSAQDVLSCAGGCDGGYSLNAWKYFKKQGVVTGSQYGQGRGCQPYLIKPCMTEYQISRPVVEPGCNKDCQSSNDSDRTIIRYKVARSYSLNNASISAIKKEIFFRGPVTTDVTVYEDFQCYMSGIYKHVVGESLGYKSVKIIGWGVENGIDYWLAANTWGSLWGEKGFFKVQMEADDRNMELHISAGIPLIQK